VSIGYRNDWADEQHITADPLEFVSLIVRSKVVITNFFHGCIFSLLNHKSFVCETSIYRSTKIQDLMRSLQAENHLLDSIQSDDQFEELLMKPAEEKVYDTINRLRRDSEQWLDQALTLKKRMFYGKEIES
jgi:exopolysaccharide biosynthesis predicted pyruvyltransferase EpsI